ncbi:MAG: outer membrane protein assembly factor BamC, partial [Gammaproteobacteria bacterium]
MVLRIHLLFIAAISVQGCGLVPSLDNVLPDKRTEYKKSEPLPDLEVPPDLTADAANDSMSIPNETEATLSQYQRQRSSPGHQAVPAAAAPSHPGEQWVSVRGSRYDIWPRLRSYFQDRGYALELEDAELGVLETGWSEPRAEGESVYRHKFKVFSEPGGEGDITVLFVSDVRQEQFTQENGKTQWLDREKSEFAEKQLAGELNLHFNQPAVAGTAAPSPAPAAAESARSRAELLNAEDGKVYLAIPEEYSSAWLHTGSALERAGFTVDGKDQAKGLYLITYFEAPAEEEGGKGWLSKLAFWKDDAPEGK